MKIIVIKDRVSKSWTYNASASSLFVRGTLLLVALPIFIGIASYWLHAKIDRSLNPFVDPEYRIAVETRVADQELDILKTRDYVRQHLDALGGQIGRLQAQLSRIDAVEMRIAKNTGIDLSDFNFDQTPAVGGLGSGEQDSEQVDIENAISDIEAELSVRETELAAMDFLLSQEQLKTKQTPTGWPVRNGWVSSKFGRRMHPVSGKKSFHRGVDIPGKKGSDVLAVADGVVKRAERSGNYGNLIEIDHGDGFTTTYAHNSKNLVTVGQTISKGEVIAKIGSSGRSTGPHVHFEVSKNGKYINPVRYLYKKI